MIRKQIFSFMSIVALSLGLSSSEEASGQCPTVTPLVYGTGCSPLFDIPTLNASYDPVACGLTLSMTGVSGCCNTFLTSKLLLIGTQMASVPAPSVGPGCTLLVQPIVIAALPASTTQIATTVSPSLVGSTIYLQVANQYFTTIGFTTDYTLSNGLSLTFSP